MAPRNKTKLAHCLIICVPLVVRACVCGSVLSLRSAFLHWYSSLFYSVFIFIIICFLCVRSRVIICLISLILCILLLFVCMWRPPAIVSSLMIFVFTFLSFGPNHIVSCALLSYQFALSFLLHSISLLGEHSAAIAGEQANVEKVKRKNGFVFFFHIFFSFLCGRIALYSSSSMCLRSIRFDFMI